MAEIPQIDVVAALISYRGRLLLAQRSEQSDQPGLWEFPGGKVEAGEAQQVALERELREELGIRATVGRYIGCESRVVSGRLIHLHGWSVTAFRGRPQPLCHQALQWCDPPDAFKLKLAPADIPLLEAWLRIRPI